MSDDSPICRDDVLPEVDAVDKGGCNRRRVAVHKTAVGSRDNAVAARVADGRAINATVQLRKQKITWYITNERQLLQGGAGDRKHGLG